MGDDHDRFSELYAACYPDVLRFAARRTDADQARDVAAETFLIAWRRFADVPGEAERLPWLYGVARNVPANQLRGERRRERLGAQIRSARRETPAPDHAGGVAASLDVRAALDRLSDRDREVLQLVAWEGLDVAAAAMVVGCSPRTLAVRLHRARKRLEKALADEGPGIRPQSFEMRGAQS
ncbi:sigma-70 family RNA polymerase sigma factor [Actinomadura barringtoniae]|uniref:Sigma-70 family RNA polymerase sigma factor n=1 Tax=Actinomadura barringtoniae TaxID=1427535 RepID=A0A939T5Y8_9ACTN|nr:sigma-70 family RNA polymerase sigma factor [Actinomadura barringtoniae]MBO2451223.1 sigma-70 family RNA polymerase sigma factor [Actinomadura barringtoniae]